MTDEYQAAVHKLMDYLSNTVVFAQAQLPDVANQMLVYGAEMAHMWMIGWIIAASLCTATWLAGEIFPLPDSDCGGVIFAFFLLSVGLWVAAGIQYSVILKIRDAPKLYIMEQLKPMLK